MPLPSTDSCAEPASPLLVAPTATPDLRYLTEGAPPPTPSSRIAIPALASDSRNHEGGRLGTDGASDCDTAEASARLYVEDEGGAEAAGEHTGGGFGSSGSPGLESSKTRESTEMGGISPPTTPTVEVCFRRRHPDGGGEWGGEWLCGEGDDAERLQAVAEGGEGGGGEVRQLRSRGGSIVGLGGGIRSGEFSRSSEFGIGGFSRSGSLVGVDSVHGTPVSWSRRPSRDELGYLVGGRKGVAAEVSASSSVGLGAEDALRGVVSVGMADVTQEWKVRGEYVSGEGGLEGGWGGRESERMDSIVTIRAAATRISA